MNNHSASLEITVNVLEFVLSRKLVFSTSNWKRNKIRSVKISMMFAKYFEYYTIILRGPFFRGHMWVYCQLKLDSQWDWDLHSSISDGVVLRDSRRQKTFERQHSWVIGWDVQLCRPVLHHRSQDMKGPEKPPKTGHETMTLVLNYTWKE